MKFSKKLIVFFSVVFAGLSTSKSFGQVCAPTFNSTITSSAGNVTINTSQTPNFACIKTCPVVVPTQPPCANYVVTVNWGSCTGSFFTNPIANFTPAGQIIIVSQNHDPITKLSTCTLQSKVDNLCKARLTFSITGVAPTIPDICSPCLAPFGPIVITRSIDIYKDISSYPAIVGPSCIKGGDLVTYSINPKLQCAADGIGIDNINWNTSDLVNPSTGVTIEYTSSDFTSYTFRIPTVWPPCTAGTGGTTGIDCVPTCTLPRTLSATVGSRCQTASAGSIPINKEISDSYITSNYIQSNFIQHIGLYHSTTAGSAFTNGIIMPMARLMSAVGVNPKVWETRMRFSVGSTQNVGSSGVSYAWTAPAGMQFESPPVLGATGMLTTDVVPTPAASEGVVNVTESLLGGNCGTSGTGFYVFRSLVTDYNTVTASNPPQGSCYRPELDNVTFTLNQAPLGTKFRWKVPAGWTITGTNGITGAVYYSQNTEVEVFSNVITARPSFGAFAGQVEVKNLITAPAMRTAFLANITNIERTILSNTLPVAGPGPGPGGIPAALSVTAPTQNIGGLTLTGNNFSPGLTSVGCAPTQMSYQWQYRGKFTPGNPGAGIPYGAVANYPEWACTSIVFDGYPLCGTQLNNPTISYKTGLMEGTTGVPNPQFRVIVTSTCPNIGTSSGCFSNVGVLTLTAGQYRMAVDPATDSPKVVVVPIKDVEKGFYFYPNPNSGVEGTLIRYKDGEATLQIHDGVGKLKLTQKLKGEEEKVDLHNLPDGVYSATLIQSGKRHSFKITVVR